MRSLQPLVLQPATWDSGAVRAGPAMTVLGTTIARIVAVLRIIALAEMVVQVLIWHAFYLAGPWRLWGPAVALGWGCAVVTYLWRHHPTQPLACADTAVYAVLALGAGWCVPPAVRGEAASWLFILVSGQIIMPTWFAPPRLRTALALTPCLALAAGTMLATSPLVTGKARHTSLALLLALVALHSIARRMLGGRAARADAALAAADRDAQAQYVLLSENIERREQDRLLHDTILNTLTAIARSGAAGAAASRCRQDIGLLERALGASAAAAGPVAAIDEVVGEMRACGLTVDLTVSPVTGHDATAPPGAPVPGPVVAAMAHATREALANVAAHAGTGTARVTVSLGPPGADGAPGRFRVRIQDEGAGFDPGQVGPARLGIRRSITERVEDRGGSASVRSAPGRGTEVRLCWPGDQARPADPGLVAAGGARRAQGQGAPGQ